MLTRNFKNLSRHDAAIAGGKGASLGEMTQAGIPVPPGFVVLSDAFEKFIEEQGIAADIDAILHKVNHQDTASVERASEEIKAIILDTEMPKDIATEIKKEFKTLGAKFVAVRSSATAEDSSSAAWAGQLDSFLNTDEKKLLENVRRCWASLFTPRAIFYRFEKGLHQTKISVAVVVQKMVQSEISGIAFSVHPVTEDRNQLIIEASYGLGEAIVSGQVTPDSYVVEKNPRKIIEQTVQAKTRGLYRSAKGENEWRSTMPSAKVDKQALTDSQILELSELILHIEKHYGFPCDIEWAFEGGKFYIVQSRPITTLAETPTLTRQPVGANGDIKFSLVFKEYHPPFWVQLWISPAYLEQYQKLSGTDVGVIYEVVNNELTGYMQADSKEVIYKSLREKTDATFFDALYKTYNRGLSKINAIKKDIDARAANGKKLSDEALLGYIDEMYQTTATMYPLSNCLYLLSDKVEEVAKEKLEDLAKTDPKINTTVSAYIEPAYETTSNVLKDELRAIKKKYFHGGKIGLGDVERQYRENATFQKAMNLFAEKYRYLTSLNLGERDVKSFFADLVGVSDHMPKAAKAPRGVQWEIDTLNYIAFFKDEISTFLIPYVKFALMGLWSQIADRLGVSFDDFEQLHMEDIKKLIDAPHKGVVALAKRRREFVAGVHMPFGNVDTTDGAAARVEYEKLLEDVLEKHSVGEDGTIVGKTGNGGKVTGVVQIIPNSAAMGEFKEGSILVTAYTAPEFVPVMKKGVL